MKDFKQQLYDLWFKLYRRTKGSRALDSSGFEHVFVGETRGGNEVLGFHNWIQFYLQEKAGNVDYQGYILGKKVQCTFLFAQFCTYNVHIVINFCHDTARVGSKESPTHPSVQVEQRGKLLCHWPTVCGFTSCLLHIYTTTETFWAVWATVARHLYCNNKIMSLSSMVLIL